MKTILVKIRDYADGEIETEEWGVNNSGEGLFVRADDGSWRQRAGNGQFYATSPRHMMRQMRARYEDQIVRMVRGSADGWVMTAAKLAAILIENFASWVGTDSEALLDHGSVVEDHLSDTIDRAVLKTIDHDTWGEAWCIFNGEGWKP